MTTLDIQFDIEKCFFAKNENRDITMLFKAGNYEGLKLNPEKLPSTFEYFYNIDSIPSMLNIDSDGHNCLIIAPIKIKDYQEEKIYGYLIITKVKEKLEEYQLTAIKTMSQLISPVIKSFLKTETIEKNYLINEEVLFLSKVKEALHAKKEYNLDFFIQYKKANQKPFQKERIIMEGVYTFDSYDFSIVYDRKKVNKQWQLIEINSIEELLQKF
jgi:hypothetical protein